MESDTSLATIMKVFYDRQDMKLVYLGQSASPDFWDSHWEPGNLKKGKIGK